jgi:WD40 repeat protein
MPKLPQPSAPEKYHVAIPVTAVAINPDGSLVASSGYHEVLIWNAQNGELIRRISNVAERTYGLQFSPDGKLLAVAAGTPGEYGEMKLFDPSNGQLVQDPLSSSDSVYCVAFSLDGTRVATGGADRSIRIFGVADGKQERLIEDHADWVMGIAWSPDGKKLASAGRDKTSKVFDALTGESQVTFSAHADAVFGVQFSPDGNQIITSGRDKQIRVWGSTDAKEAKVIGGFGNEVYGLQLTPDGRLFSASADMTAREHKLDGTEVRKFSGHADWVYSLSFNAAGNKLVTGSWDGELRLWNAADGQMLLKFVAAPGLAVAGK